MSKYRLIQNGYLHMFVTDCTHPVSCSARVFSATFANLQPTSPTVSASVNNTSQLNPAPAAGSVWVRAGVVPVG